MRPSLSTNILPSSISVRFATTGGIIDQTLVDRANFMRCIRQYYLWIAPPQLDYMRSEPRLERPQEAMVTSSRLLHESSPKSQKAGNAGAYKIWIDGRAWMRKRVLIVDDRAFMRNMIRDIFTSGGFDVVGEAGDGLQAIQKFEELKPDIVTMDIVMPFRSGIEATREIVRLHPKAIVIVCSALGQEALVMEAIEAGAADFVVKPFKAEDVLGVVKKVLSIESN